MKRRSNKIFTIAKYEFLVTVRRKAFFFTALGLPLFIILSGGIGFLYVTRSVSQRILNPAAIVDQSKVVDLDLLTILAAKDHRISLSTNSDQTILKSAKDSLIRSVRFEYYATVDRAIMALA